MMLKKKYYDGTQVHRIISEEVKDYETIMKILKRFADEPSAQPEPCEDAVSREAVLDALRTCYDTETITYDNGDEYIHYGDAVGEVEQLPSVTPKQRTGKWIHVSEEMWKCDQCGEISCCSPNFCPDCGAKMGVTT